MGSEILARRDMLSVTVTGGAQNASAIALEGRARAEAYCASYPGPHLPGAPVQQCSE